MMLLSEAIAFASCAHDGAMRRGTTIPYIVHPMEAVSIAATLTDDEEVLAAAALHDVIEDCGVTGEELSARFGPRVAELVLCETQRVLGDPGESWLTRKREIVCRLREECLGAKIVALSDKLSNMRAISRDFDRIGEATFAKFHQNDIRWHAWYYRSCAEMLMPELGDTQAWKEFSALIERVFGNVALARDGS